METLDQFFAALDEDEGIVAASCSTAAWDGSASRFSDEQYRRSCVLDRGDCGDVSDLPVKQRYSLPIREPGGAFNKAAISAAKGRLGQTSACAEAKAKASARLDRAASACGIGESKSEAGVLSMAGQFHTGGVVPMSSTTVPLAADVTAPLWMPGTVERSEPQPAWDSRVIGQLAAVAGRPWCLKPEAMDVLVSTISGGVSAHEIMELPEPPKPSKRAGIAIIPLSGLLTPSGGGPLGALLGVGAGLSDFRSALTEVLADDEIKAIVLDVNSPGGLVDHIPETAAALRTARQFKPITAVASTQAASAAYWLASQANEIVVTPSGEVGSIGAYMLHMDKSGHLAKEGLDVTLTSAGKYKTEGNQYEPLSESAKQAQQRKVDRFYTRFVDDVAAGRGVDPDRVRNGYGEGRTLLAEDAVEQGLADRIATVDQVIFDTTQQVALEAERQPVKSRSLARAQRRVEVLLG